MAMIPAAAAGGGPSLLGQAARYIAGQAIAGAVEGGATRARKRAYAATSGEGSGGQNASTKAKVPRPAPRIANAQLRRAVEHCCLSMLENKVAYTQNSSATAANTFVFDLVNNIGGGVDQGQRVGNKIHNGYLKLKLCITSGGSTTSDFCRWGILLDTMPGGTAVNSADVFQDPTRGATTLYRNDTVGRGRRFMLIKDMRVALNAESGPGRRVFDVGLPLRCITQFNGNGTAISDINTNALYVFYFGVGTAGAASVWVWDAELFYKDG